MITFYTHSRCRDLCARTRLPEKILLVFVRHADLCIIHTAYIITVRAVYVVRAALYNITQTIVSSHHLSSDHQSPIM